MRKNLIPRESLYWKYMKMREGALNERDNAQTDEERKSASIAAFEFRLKAIDARRSELKTS